MTKIVTIGSICQDIFFPTNEGVLLETPDDVLSQKKLAFELGGKYAIEDRFDAVGGQSINVAVGLAKLGESVLAYSTVGDDAIGKWILKELEKTKVNIGSIKVENNCRSDLSTILVDGKNNDRIIFSNHVASGKLSFDEKRFGNPEWIFIGDLSGNWQKISDEIIAFTKKKNINLAFNPRQKTIHDDVRKVIETISKCEMLFVNKDEAVEIVTGFEKDVLPELLEHEEYLAKALYGVGVKIVILTDGPRGAWAYDGIDVMHVEAKLRKVVDSTGAGDAFTSGFFAAHLKGKNLLTCLKWGTANSSSSLTEYGGQKGLLDEQQISAN